MTRDTLIARVSALLHADQMTEAAYLVADFSRIPRSFVKDNTAAIELCSSLFYWCLNNGRYPDAARMIWNESIFNYAPRCTSMVWEEIEKSNSLFLMGAASQSKSYGAGAWLLLDWVRDPENTSVALVGPSEDHLKDNLFTHLVTMHAQSTLPLPGIVGDLFIGLDPRKRKGAIRGIIIPRGKGPAGRLQGRKRVPRKTPHPQFGTMSRMRIFLDELEQIPLGVWKDIDNVFANLGKDDVGGFKIIGAFNPTDPEGQTAQRCEPEKGWEAFDPENDEKWVSKRGWNVLRLDAAKSENVVQKKEIFVGLQTYEGFQRIISNSGGTDTPGYWTMGRACFPRGGSVHSVISSTLVTRLRGEFMFAEEPENCASTDIALEGMDAAVFAAGRFGKAIGVRYYPSFDHPAGREVFFTDTFGKRCLKLACQIDQIFSLPRGDTVAMAERIRQECVKFKVKPGWLMLDRTGNGAGVHDLLKSLWSSEVRGVNYNEGASETKILEEDTKTAKEEYERAVSELWFALKKWSEFGFVRITDRALTDDLKKQLSGRRYMAGKVSRVESKIDYKSRGNSSPNEADAVTLLLHGVRQASGAIPCALDASVGTTVGAGAGERPPVPCWTGHSDELSHIEDEAERNYLD